MFDLTNTEREELVTRICSRFEMLPKEVSQHFIDTADEMHTVRLPTGEVDYDTTIDATGASTSCVADEVNLEILRECVDDPSDELMEDVFCELGFTDGFNGAVICESVRESMIKACAKRI